MSKSYSGPWVLRSMLFVPGHIEKMARKAAVSDADCVVLDLQDAVPEDKKLEARSLIRLLLDEQLFARKTVFVRVNPLENGQTLIDLEAVACHQLNGFVYPMAYTAQNIVDFDAQLRLKETSLGLETGHFSVIVLVETAMGVLNALPLARSSDRIVGMLFGCEDYLAETQARHSATDESLLAARSQIVHACRAVGIEPIDTPYVKVHDSDGLRSFAERARNLGMAGMLAMSPRQIPVIHEVYTPSQDEIMRAQRMVSAADCATMEGRGITVADDMFVSPPTLRAARKTLARAQAIESLVKQ